MSAVPMRVPLWVPTMYIHRMYEYLQFMQIYASVGSLFHLPLKILIPSGLFESQPSLSQIQESFKSWWEFLNLKSYLTKCGGEKWFWLMSFDTTNTNTCDIPNNTWATVNMLHWRRFNCYISFSVGKIRMVSNSGKITNHGDVMRFKFFSIWRHCKGFKHPRIPQIEMPLQYSKILWVISLGIIKSECFSLWISYFFNHPK